MQKNDHREKNYLAISKNLNLSIDTDKTYFLCIDKRYFNISQR